jgi:hypothetical protein
MNMMKHAVEGLYRKDVVELPEAVLVYKILMIIVPEGAAQDPEDVGVVHSAFRDPIDSGSRMHCVEGTGMVEENE